MLARMPTLSHASEIHGWCWESRCPRNAWNAKPGTIAQDMRMKNSRASALTAAEEPSKGMKSAAACEPIAATTLIATARTMPCRRIAGADSPTPAPLSCDW